MNAPSRPVLRYHGGKWVLAPWVIEHFPKHRVYVEPFGGAASVLLRKPRSYAEVYNDLEGGVVNLFRVLRDPRLARALRRSLELTPFAREEFAAARRPAEDPVEAARSLIVLSFMGFGSAGVLGETTGFRANSNRSGTTPAHDWANFPRGLDAVTERLQGVVIENQDALICMERHDGPDTLHYVDPPYVMSTRSSGHSYKHEMTADQHEELLWKLKCLEGMVVLSGYPSGLYDGLLTKWERVERKALADGARARTEVLWLNPAATAARSAGPLFEAFEAAE